MLLQRSLERRKVWHFPLHVNNCRLSLRRMVKYSAELLCFRILFCSGSLWALVGSSSWLKWNWSPLARLRWQGPGARFSLVWTYVYRLLSKHWFQVQKLYSFSNHEALLGLVCVLMHTTHMTIRHDKLGLGNINKEHNINIYKDI